MDKNTYEYLKKRVDAFEKNKSKLKKLKSYKEGLANLEAGDNPNIMVFGQKRCDLFLTISQFNAIKNDIINELNVEIKRLEKEIKEI